MIPEEVNELETWLDHYMDHVAGDRETAPSLADLPPSLRDEARRRAFTVSELWGRAASPSEGPSALAAAFGFDRLDEPVAVDGIKLRAARKSTGLKVSELARELTRLGWSISAAELGEIESGKRPDVPGTAIPLLVSYLDMPADALAATHVPKVDQLLARDRIRNQIEGAAQRLGRSFNEISAILRPQLASAHFREHDQQEDDVAEIVQNILDGIE